MSLSSLLLGKGRQPIDTELDTLFKSNTNASRRPPPVTPAPTSASVSKSDGKKDKAELHGKKRKHAAVVDQQNAALPEEPSKRSKPSKPSKSNKRQQKSQAADLSKKSVKKPEDVRKAEKAKKGKEKTEKKKKAKVAEITHEEVHEDEDGEGEDENDEEENNSDLERSYASKVAKKAVPSSSKGKAEHHQSDEEDQDEEGNEDTDETDEEDDDAAPPVHESLQAKQKSGSKKSKAKYAPSDETPAQRNLRTIFVGNLSVEVASKRPLLRQLHRHILTHVPTAKIESTRFRSIPFQVPTSKLPSLDDNEDSKSKSQNSSKTARPHDVERALTWRGRKTGDGDEFEVQKDEKKYLTPQQKKKIAFINHEFHATADTVHAYVVFAHPVPREMYPPNVPPPPAIMDPYEAAREAAKTCDGTVFMERAIRVDLVGKKGETRKGGEEDAVGGLVETDPKLSVFVGNLDFESKEDDLRSFFEGVVKAERGSSPPSDETKPDPSKLATWVTRVRIIRDKDTQLGKGFAYVQFADRQCVDEVLALEESKLKFAKRKLRVQRCKTIPGSSSSTRQITKDYKPPKPGTSSKDKTDKDNKPIKQKSSSSSSAPVPIVVPKGDPKLGERLAHLSKEARKKAKAGDADRRARRLAKKKARMALSTQGGVKVRHGGNERERERKVSSKKPRAGGKAGAMEVKKKRVRSEKSLAKMNAKK